jgi:hypothetical protein
MSCQNLPYTAYHITPNGSSASAASAELQTTRNSSLAAWKATTDPCQSQLVPWLAQQPAPRLNDPALRRHARAVKRAVRDLKRELRRAAREPHRERRKTPAQQYAPATPSAPAAPSPSPLAAQTSPAPQTTAPPAPEGGGDGGGGGDQSGDGDGDPSHAAGSEPSRSRRSLGFPLLALSDDGGALVASFRTCTIVSWTLDAHTSLEVRP